MPNKVIAQNLYRTSVTSAAAIPASGDFQFDVAVAPAQKNGFLILGSENIATRQIFYFHDVIGNTIYVRGINRINAAAIAVPTGYSVKMNDVAELFNYYGDNISTLFYIEKMGGLSAKVWGGYLMYNNNQVLVADTTLTLTDSTTNYVKYNPVTNTISADTVATGNIKCEIVCNSGAITSILYRTSKESYLDFAISITGALPSQGGNSGKVLGSDGTNVSWVTKNDYAIDTGAVNAYVATIPGFQLSTGSEVSVKIVNANTGTSTINVNGTGVKTIKKNVSSDLISGDILPGQVIKLIYDGTNFQFVGGALIPSDIVSSVTITPYESGIAIGDTVGITPEGVYKCNTELASSINITASSITVQHGSVKLSDGVYCFMYSVGVNVFARVGTLTGDTIAYGTELALFSGATGNISGQVVSIGTNKVAFAMVDSTAITQTRHIIGTISGTTISVGSTYTFTYNPQGNQATYIASAIRIRDDVYAVAYISGSYSSINIHTVSGTVITNSTSPWSNGGSGYNSINMTYIADNMIGFNYSYYSSPNNRADVYLFSINPSGTNVLTTYSYQFITSALSSLYLIKYSSTEILVTHQAGSAYGTYGLKIPGAGTTLVLRTLFDNGTNVPLVYLYDTVFGLLNGTTLSIYNDSVLIGVITGLTSPGLGASLYGSLFGNKGRLCYLSGANGTFRIIKLANSFFAGIAKSIDGGTFLRGVVTKTGVSQGSLYYLQADGTIGTIKTQKYIGKGIGTNILYL